MVILFWGTGSFAFNWIKNNSILLANFEHIKFVSKNPNEKKFLENEVITPEEIATIVYDKLCILSSFEKNIREEAIKTYHVPLEKLITFQELEELIINIRKAKKTFGEKILIRHLAQNETEITSMINDYYDYKYLKEKYQNYLNEYKHNDVNNSNNSKIIWICWFQGYENAPKIVQACINSIKKNMSKHKIILITEKNFNEFVTFPKYILENYKIGNISKTHFSDLLRLELLIQYGGIWMDATLLLTSPVPTFIQNSTLFLFNFNKEQNRTIEPRKISTWFIVAASNNKILMLTKELLYKYWSENDRLFNYFLIHYFFRMSTEKFSKDWNNKLHIIINSNFLAQNLFSKFEKEKYKIIKEISFCQKLSYKLEIPKIINGTFYDAILKEYLYC